MNKELTLRTYKYVHMHMTNNEAKLRITGIDVNLQNKNQEKKITDN